MKEWLLLSFLLPLFSAGYTLLTKIALHSLTPQSFSMYSLVIALVILSGYNVMNGKKIRVTPLSFVGGLAFGFAIMGLTTGINEAPNPGLAAAIYRTQTILTAIASVFLFGKDLDLQGIVGMVITLAGAYLIATDKKDIVETGIHPGTAKAEKRVLNRDNWFIYPALAGVALTVKDLTGMESLQTGMPASIFATSQLLFAAVVAAIHKYYVDGTLTLEFKKNAHEKEAVTTMTGAAIINSAWVVVAIAAMTMAPNPGYSKALTMGGIIISTIASRFMFGDKLDSRSYGGIAAIVAGTAILVAQKKTGSSSSTI